ncbi:hypothetical protein DI09_104p30 [Mitosporidium daphniae]|uniref:Essential protein Yae1 N-terminal domain-containing protein n=1 Tax=Mitosporidium daphniae TaxID=1485682 RepID=A0A098VZK9_9MICR|nr:uncharacterized protein DI09_104p30 [Mitosporidium daphniae]KGG53196.1 hypothetical protein DI09_104p30 [Mitosporidium daphniae]|eukprot:XP_013239634.1 uncharacterized protein DI09_104p30 [Mitosporidium daphniae]
MPATMMPYQGKKKTRNAKSCRNWGAMNEGDIFEEALLADSMAISDAYKDGYSAGHQEKSQDLFRQGFDAGFQMSTQLANLASDILNCPNDAKLRGNALSIAMLLSKLELENSDESALLLEKILKIKIISSPLGLGLAKILILKFNPQDHRHKF